MSLTRRPKDIKKGKKKKEAENMLKIRCNYEMSNLLSAIDLVKYGESITASSRGYSVPESTITAHIRGKYSMKKPEPCTILSEIEEEDLEKWIFHCAKQGFPVTKELLVDSLQLLLVYVKRENPFKNGIPGRHWYEGFLRIYPNVSKRLTENVSLRRAQISEIDIRE